MTAKEVGDEWALSKQHSRQEVPIGGFARRQEVCCCLGSSTAMCGGVGVTPWARLALSRSSTG